MQVNVGCSRLSWPLSIESTPVRTLHTLLIQHELVHEPQGTHASWHRIYITALAAMCHSSFGCRRYCCFTDQVLRLRQETTRTSATLSVARAAGHARDGSRQPTTTEARCEEDHMRLPRNDARCKLETRDLPTHCPAKRPTKEAPLRRV